MTIHLEFKAPSVYFRFPLPVNQINPEARHRAGQMLSDSAAKAKLAQEHTQDNHNTDRDTQLGSSRPHPATFPGSGKQNKHSPNAVEQTWAHEVQTE